MIACIDVGYDDQTKRARAACVTLNAWTDSQPVSEHVLEIDDIQPYQSGQFYKRELPCVLSVIDALPKSPETIVVDGYVWLSDAGKKGLGGYVYESLQHKCIVVGVAKTIFANASAMEVCRGNSNRPLYITAAGIDTTEAAKHIERMHGPHRMPTLLKRADQLSRTPT